MIIAEVYLEILEIQLAKVDFQSLTKLISSKVDAIKLAITKTVSGLDLEDARGQSYDGCGAMAGKEKGVVARFRKRSPKMPFVHCHSHRLNLCVMKVIKVA